MSESRVLVVGTTGDYIRWVSQHFPGRALFVTDHRIRQMAIDPPPPPGCEILSDLSRPRQVRRDLAEHMKLHDIRPVGIVCYDCESMPLAADLAASLGLPYPGATAIEMCRDKARCKAAWTAADVPCPASEVITTAEEALAFHEAHGECVLKPLTGTGSELVFRCADATSVREAVRLIHQGLRARSHTRLYAGAAGRMAIEEFVSGPEFSCDFIVDDGRAKIVRLSRKIPMRGGPFGIIQGYRLPCELPPGNSLDLLVEIFGRAAAALELTRAMCMVDFLASPRGPKLLELAPRPGGDCLPSVIRHAAGVDMLAEALNFAEGWPLAIPDFHGWKPTVGLRIYGRTEGVLSGVDFSAALADPRVLETHMLAAPGDRIVLPPKDYDSWVLGHLIFRPDPRLDLDAQCEDLLAKVRIEMKGRSCPPLPLSA